MNSWCSIALLLLVLAGCGDDRPASTASAQTTDPVARATEPASANEVPTAAGEEAPAAEEPLTPDEPIEIDPDLAEADLDGVEIQVAPSTNLFVAAYQQRYVTAVKDASDARRTAAAVAENEKVFPSTPHGVTTNANAAAAAATGATAALTSASVPSSPPVTSTPPTSSPATAAIQAAPATPPIDEATVLADTHGQWATGAEASSYYGGDTSARPRYGAIQATGPPSVAQYSDNPNAWAARTGDSPNPEWLSLEYAAAVHATSVKVRQSCGPGAISKVELIDEAGTAHVIWEGADSTAYPKNTIGWFVRDFPRTDYLVKRVSLTLLTNRVWGFNEIDAAQLVGSKD